MNPSFLFLVGLGLTLVTSLVIVIYLQAPLRGILTELCGTPERAAFWAAFSNVTVTLLPLIFAMQYTPAGSGERPAALDLATQLKWSLAGLLSAVVVLGWVLSRFIPLRPTSSGAAQPGKAAA